MPEHVHLVLLPHSGVRIQSILGTMKLSISRRAIRWLKEYQFPFLEQLGDMQPNGKELYRFWQRGGGYDRNLRSVRDVHEKILYVHNNPVTRGLVKLPEQWKYSSAAAWQSGTDDLISLDRTSVPSLSLLDDLIGSDLLRWRTVLMPTPDGEGMAPNQFQFMGKGRLTTASTVSKWSPHKRLVLDRSEQERHS